MLSKACEVAHPLSGTKISSMLLETCFARRVTRPPPRRSRSARRVSEGILFYRYQSKEALLAAVIRRETQPPEALREIVKTAGRRSLRENLERIVETSARIASPEHTPFWSSQSPAPAPARSTSSSSRGPSKPPPQQHRGASHRATLRTRAVPVVLAPSMRTRLRARSLVAASITCGPGKGQVTTEGRRPSCGAWSTCSRTAPSRRLPRDDKGECCATHECNFIHPLFEESLNNVCLPVPPACASRGHAGRSRLRRLCGRAELPQAGAEHAGQVEPDRDDGHTRWPTPAPAAT